MIELNSCNRGDRGISRDAYDNQKEPLQESSSSIPCKELRAIAYSMDAWFGSLRIRIGGSEAEQTYPGTIPSFTGIALVLPGYRIFSTYQGEYNPLITNISSASISTTALMFNIKSA